MSEVSATAEEFWEYQIEWTYPYLENQGRTNLGPIARTLKEAYPEGDDGWDYAGKLIAVRKRWVRRYVSDWVETSDRES